MLWVALILVAGLAAPIVIEALRRPMTDAARTKAPGQFVKLSQGTVHYQWYGPERGPVAVCVHGLTTPSFVWRALAPELVAMGFRVLVYDHYGRGFSDRVSGPQDPAFFQTLLNDLLADQEVGRDITLIGYSMGGAIAAGFAAGHPERLRQLVLLAPAGMATVMTGMMARAIRVPVVGAWLMLARYPGLLRAGITAERSEPSYVDGITDLQEAELNWRGFVPAVHRSLRDMLATELRPNHEAIERAGLPVLAIWGARDTVIPISASKTLESWNPNVKTAVVDEAGHGLVYLQTPQVAGHLRGFLNAST